MIWVFDLVDGPVASPILAYVFSDNFVLFGEDLILSRSLFSFASDHEFLASWWLSPLQSCLCDLLESHLEWQERLEYSVVEFEPVWLFVAPIDLS